MNILILLGILIIVLFGVFLGWNYESIEVPQNVVSTFDECVALGNPVLESYPRQCMMSDKQAFIEDIGNELEKQGVIRVSKPRPNELVKSPLEIMGEARGYWFFEAVFPVGLVDEDGNELASGIATAESEWMTEDFVPFTAKLDFQMPSTEKGNLILKRDNPSGLEENEDQLRIPVRFKE